MTKPFSSCARFIAGVFFLALLGGCAAQQTQALLKERAARLPVRSELTETPFFPQETHQCGPASLAMALNAAGARTTPQELADLVYLPGREGSLQVEMLAAARRRGAFAYELEPRLEVVLTEVAAGTPVVVLQNLALSWYPLWHYAVVVGYDLEREEVVLRSGLDRRQVLPLSTFEHTWRRSGYWAMVVLPPGRMPRTATESVYVSAAVALERAGPPRAAQAAYEAALERWPRNLSARIGQGNTAHAQGNLVGAEEAFRQAAQDHPDSAAAFNNLAHTLADQGRHIEALAAARRAVAIGGPLEAASRKTLEQIEASVAGRK
ncbi:MAG: PA2778 family cysteine peptidase [Pseudomonadota bacterium]